MVTLTCLGGENSVGGISFSFDRGLVLVRSYRYMQLSCQRGERCSPRAVLLWGPTL